MPVLYGMPDRGLFSRKKLHLSGIFFVERRTDQPGRPSSMTKCLRADSEDSDLTGRFIFCIEKR